MSNSYNILCVDDDKDCCRMISLMLKLDDFDCSVTSANSAKDALSILEKNSFDLFILDYRMPEMTGMELCNLIRQKNKQTPIMFFSALGRDIDRKNAIAAGANDYLIKPNDLERLTKTVKRLVSDTLVV